MCVCMYGCKFACMYVCMLDIRVYVCTCTHMYVSVCMCLPVCLSVYLNVCPECLCASADVATIVQTRICVLNLDPAEPSNQYPT